MRDTFLAADHRTELMDRPLKSPNTGMRHSIRPRRSLLADTTPAELPATIEEPRRPERTTAYRPDPSMPRWHDLSLVEAGARQKSRIALPVVDNDRESASVRAFDLLRTRLRQTTQEHGWTNIAITAPTSGCGTTFTAANLALSLSRVAGSRTLLMDFNLRNPGIANALNVTAPGPVTDLLQGHSAIGDHLFRVSETLALGLNSTPDRNASETLQSAETAHALERMRASLQPELVLYDLPAMLAYDDVSAFLPQLDGVLLVSDGTQTMAQQLLECERMLEGQVPLLGVVLNRARANSIPRYS